ncbi:ROK family protein [Yangia mangrovi]|uniref:ROK family protein n=1 Tax=Alloyangia mangrovi TaxID=1779329 RepID=A0ABT2KLQ9_9RHOB|nr:ROK family protein [Alloyangia mangrovi]MCA0940110.1 ROK family protein [Alloyangia pacifica]MCA0945723.1 ROK family protein [Alloyangia pacifica]MCT4370462.1 ROK family protein [Alloyangia mangrovi]
MNDEAEIIGCGPLLQSPDSALRPLRQQVFEHVRALGRVPRVQVAKDLRVSPASVTTITSELIETGFLEEVQAARVGDSGRGRPAVALQVRPGVHHVMGMKLSDIHHTAVLADLSGRVIATASMPRTPGQLSVQAVGEVTEALMREVCGAAGVEAGSLRGLGLGVPGFVDAETGLVRWSPILDLRDTDLSPALSQRLGLPVHIDNDANLVTLAELWFGAGRTMSNFAVVTIEHGVGMGFVMNHRLYRGAHGMGMELGHMKVHLDGALCRCGQRGCLEAYVADYALVREARTALNLPDLETRSVRALLESLFSQAKAGNPAAHSIFRRAGRYLSLALANVTNLFDPQLIILSGERMRYDYLYAEGTLTEMKTMMIETGRGAPKVEIHAWGDMVWARGAAALALETLTEQMLGAGREMAAQ